MDLTIDDQKLAYFIAKLPLTAKIIEEHVKELVEILQFEKKRYESKFEDPEHNLWELSTLIAHFEKVLRSLNSTTFRLHIKDLEIVFANRINLLRKGEK